MFSEIVDIKYHELVDNLEISLAEVRKKLQSCGNDILKYFLAEIILPREKYEIAGLINSMLEERECVFEEG